MQKYKFVINPVPLKRKHKIFLKKLKERMLKNKIEFSYEYTTKQKNAEIISRNAALKGCNVIVACGGDGTVMEVINGIYKTKSKLGILPLGTSNDFAKHLGINKLDTAAERLFNGKPKNIDLGLVEIADDGKRKKLLFCSTSGVGFDAKLLKLNNYRIFIRMKKLLGNIIYPLCGLFMVFWYKGSDAEIKIKNNRIKTKLFMMNANFVKSMSGMKVTPNADVDNGAFELFIAEESSLLKKLAGFLWYSFTSKKIGFKEVYNLNDVKSFSISSKNKIDVQLNGDFVGYTPVKFKILPKALQLLK